MLRGSVCLLLFMPLSVTGFVKNLSDDLAGDERGLSGVAVTILLILVIFLAAALIWGFRSGWIPNLVYELKAFCGGDIGIVYEHQDLL